MSIVKLEPLEMDDNLDVGFPSDDTPEKRLAARQYAAKLLKIDIGKLSHLRTEFNPEMIDVRKMFLWNTSKNEEVVLVVFEDGTPTRAVRM